MSIFDFFVSVKITDGFVYVTGINNKRLMSYIKKLQGDGRFNTNVLEPIYRGFKFREFFIPDFYYIVKRLHDSKIGLSYKSTLQTILEKLKENTWLKNLDSGDNRDINFNLLKDINLTPTEYQLNFYKYYNTTVHKLKLKGTLLDAAAGTGKSAMALTLGHLLEADRIIVICPLNSVSKVWEEHINRIFNKPISYHLSIDKEKYNNEKIMVYHFEALNKVIEDYKNNPSNGKVVIVLDESHNFNELKSQRSNLFLELCKITNSNDILFQSGTAVKALGSELVVLFKAVDPLFTEDVQSKFTRLFGNKSSSSNLDLLNARLGLISFKVLKSETNLKEPITIQLPIKVKNSDKYTLENVSKEMGKFIIDRKYYYAKRHNEDLKLYNNFIEQYKLSLNDETSIKELNEYINNVNILIHSSGSLSLYRDIIVNCNKFENNKIIPTLSNIDKNIFKEVKTLIKYPSLKVQGEALGKVLTRMRIDCFVDISKNIDYETIIEESEKKVVIFTSYIEVCDSINETLRNNKYIPVSVYGKYTKDLNKNVGMFNNDIEANPLVTTFDSLSTAVPLIVANSIIFVNLPYRSYIKEQATARVYRLGQDTQTFMYEAFLDTGDKPNLSTRNIDILEWSKKQVQAIMGVSDDVDWDELEGISSENTPISTVSNELYDINISLINIEYKRSLINKW